MDENIKVELSLKDICEIYYLIVSLADLKNFPVATENTIKKLSDIIDKYGD